MNKKLIKMSIVAVASAFAIAPLAMAQDKEEGAKKPEAPKRERPARGGAERGGGAGGFDREAMFVRMFERIDADKSGGITLEELKTSRSARTGGQRGGAPGTRPEGGARPERGTRPEGGGARPERGPRPEGGARPERGPRPEGGDRPAPPSVEEQFKEMNTDGNDVVSKEEFVASIKKRFAGRGGPRGPRPEGGARPDGAKDPEAGKAKKRPAADDDKS